MRARLDAELGVTIWSVPGADRTAAPVPVVEPGAPAWWHGDEEASRSFFTGMGLPDGA